MHYRWGNMNSQWSFVLYCILVLQIEVPRFMSYPFFSQAK